MGVLCMFGLVVAVAMFAVAVAFMFVMMFVAVMVVRYFAKFEEAYFGMFLVAALAEIVLVYNAV